jgi:hypothetical protein
MTPNLKHFKPEAARVMRANEMRRARATRELIARHRDEMGERALATWNRVLASRVQCARRITWSLVYAAKRGVR